MATHLVDLGWSVEVLTVREGCYDRLDPTLLTGGERFGAIRTPAFFPRVWLRRLRTSPGSGAASRPAEIEAPASGWPGIVARASRLCDVLFSIPDREVGWVPFALWGGWRRARRPDLVLATQPPFTDVLIGGVLSRVWGVPLVLDYRDPWSTRTLEEGSPRWRRSLDRTLERAFVRQAALVVTTTPGIAEDLAAIGLRRTTVIPNAFDREALAGITPVSDGRFTVLYAGTFYAGRTAGPVFEALRRLKSEGLPPAALRLRVMGANGPGVRAEAARLGVSDLIEDDGFRSYPEAMARMLGADVLLLVVGAEHRRQVPAKLFDYIAAGRFILALAPEGSEAGRIVEELGVGGVVDPGDPAAIAALLRERMSLPRGPRPLPAAALRYEARATMEALDRELRLSLARP